MTEERRTIDIVPEFHPFLDYLAAVTEHQHHSALTGCHDTSIWSEEPVTRMQNRIQHRFVEEGIAHPFGYDDVDVLNAIGEADVFHLPTDHAGVARIRDKTRTGKEGPT